MPFSHLKPHLKHPFSMSVAWRRAAPRAGAAVALLLSLAVQAQPQAAPATAPETLSSLKQAHDLAWARQPQAVADPMRREAARSHQQAASAWTAGPAALSLANTTDRFQRDEGRREWELGVAVPLWMPGERQRSQALADAEARALDSRQSAAQLRLAAELREAYWA